MKRRKKGFTLMELIIVISIFGVLVAVITPSWTYYARRAKFKSNNEKAKTVFNAAQTVLVDLEFTERKYRAAYSLGDADVIKYIYTPETDGTEWYFYWNGRRGYRSDAAGNELTSIGTGRDDILDEWNEKMASSINRIVDEDMIYKIRVRDYKVEAVVTARADIDRYLGAHPTSILDLRAEKIDTSDLEHTNARQVDLGWFDLDRTNNPSSANAS